MPIDAQAVARDRQVLGLDTIRHTISTGFADKFTGAKVLVLIPDHTRTIPLPQLFPILVEALRSTKQLDFMVALGTHPPLDNDSLNRLVGITDEQRTGVYRHIGLLNHAWDQPDALTTIGI